MECNIDAPVRTSTGTGQALPGGFNMGPWFTSREEWMGLRPAGRRAYIRLAVGYMLQAGILGLAILILVCGAADPYWRSAAVLTVSAMSLAGGGVTAYLLFRREWQAAERAYDAV
jgi:hypothetical protein